MKKTIFCRVVVPGYHNYPEHSDFLKFKHRHLFHIEVELYVSDSNREVEFFDLQKQVLTILSPLLYDGVYDFEFKSCEHIAEFLWDSLAISYSIHSITVSEDNENGATVYGH